MLIYRFKVHWPVNFAAVDNPEKAGQILLQPQKNGDMVIDTKTSLIDTWNAMTAMKNSGKVRRYVECFTRCFRSFEQVTELAFTLIR